MKSVIAKTEMLYDGSQLKSRYIYWNHSISGPAILSFIGPCDVKPEYMADGEDLLAGSQIKSDRMLHFLIEDFDKNLNFAVALQRLFACVVKEQIESISGALIKRSGDDLYFQSGKLSISVAVQSVGSILIHFAINITNEGTPVKTSCLKDLNIDPDLLQKRVHQNFTAEYQSILEAGWKTKVVL